MFLNQLFEERKRKFHRADEMLADDARRRCGGWKSIGRRERQLFRRIRLRSITAIFGAKRFDSVMKSGAQVDGRTPRCGVRSTDRFRRQPTPTTQTPLPILIPAATLDNNEHSSSSTAAVAQHHFISEPDANPVDRKNRRGARYIRSVYLMCRA